MNTSNSTWIENWQNYFILFSYFCFGVAVVIVLIHEVRIMNTAKGKDRYEYVNLHEIRFFWYAILALIAGASLILTAFIVPLVPVDAELKIFVAIFFLSGFVVVAYYILSNLVKTLYPKFLENRLSRIRHSARKSRAGNRMRKLSVEEGAVHLDATQLSEQKSDIHSVEYDVWIDEKTGEKLIEKYMPYQHAERCVECGFYTLKIVKEEITREPTQQDAGILVEHYRCSYCKHREARQITIAALSTNK